ncbi:MAG: acetyl-CoA decarbonylase/synthase complex subunit delta [Chloroflexi bacterium]|nr:acetyl-CoA decarbonylase/synthase complex subunit delta [Chloroflexota bacterium]
MAVEIPVEKWAGKVREVTIGATASEGGTRSKTVTVGGESTLPFLQFEGQLPHRPVIAVEIHDAEPTDWSPTLLGALGDVVKDPAAWAKKAEEWGADLIFMRLVSTNPDGENRKPEAAAEVVKSVLKAVGLPLIVYGGAGIEHNPDVLVKVAQATEGERLVLGPAEDKNYRTIVAGCLAHGHIVSAFTPMDLNLAKQLNILVSDVGLSPDRIIVDPNTGALGYGLEYCVSVIERLRLSALQGDSMTQMPIISLAGEESWRTKESKVSEGVPEAWGDFAELGLIWETTTATTLLHSGADIVTLRHPKSVALIKSVIDKLGKGA